MRTAGALLVMSVMAGCMGEASEGFGEVRAPLATTATDGTQYRLRSAVFTITGASSASLATDDIDDRFAVLSQELPVGGYAMTLEPGWSLWRRRTDGTTVLLEATLISTNPQYFAVSDGVVTTLRWVFRADGEVVELGTGSVDVVFSVCSTEVCDLIDNDCDGDVDEGCVDADSDGYFATDDCDDTDPLVNPGATEIPGDEIDEDCDFSEFCFVDADGDGVRIASLVVSYADVDCADVGEARVDLASGDCNDSNASISPNATETPGNGVDENCDGQESCYRDADVDGYGTLVTIVSPGDTDCIDPGEASTAGDCDDTDARVHPGQTAFFTTATSGGGFDYDCDGLQTPSVSGVFACAAGCSGGGWTSVVPDCGVQAEFGFCFRPPFLACTNSTRIDTQACR